MSHLFEENKYYICIIIIISVKIVTIEYCYRVRKIMTIVVFLPSVMITVTIIMVIHQTPI